MTPRAQNGAVTLLMCSLLLMLLALSLLWTARPLAAAQRMATNDHRTAMAVQAADAGLAWAAAMLNTGRVDEHCRPTFYTGLDFRERALSIAASGIPSSAQAGTWIAACASSGAQRWHCRCDGQWPLVAGTSSAPGLDATFAIRITDTDAPGQLSVVARGCSGSAEACAHPDLPPAPSTGQAEHAQHVALLSALRRPPSAPVVEGSNAFVRVFGFPSAQYRLQPGLTRLRCGEHCGPDLRQALARGRRMIWIDGSVILREALPLPPDDLPMVLLVDGQLDIETAMQFTGVIYARSGIGWKPPAGTHSRLRGALVTDGRLQLDAPPTVVALEHDEGLLERIRLQMGSYLPVPGGWSSAR